MSLMSSLRLPSPSTAHLVGRVVRLRLTGDCSHLRITYEGLPSGEYDFVGCWPIAREVGIVRGYGRPSMDSASGGTERSKYSPLYSG